MGDSEPCELLPCPFCGVSAVMEQHGFRWAVYCTGQYCGCSTPLCSTPLWAARYWNRRDWKNPTQSQAIP